MHTRCVSLTTLSLGPWDASTSRCIGCAARNTLGAILRRLGNARSRGLLLNATEVRRRNFIRLLLEKLSGDKLGRTIEFYLFVGSIANRALASEVKEEVLLAGQLFLSLENHRESTPWLPLNGIKAQKRRAYSVCRYDEKLFSRPLWVHFLYQILTGNCTDSAKLAEATLTYLYSVDSSVITSYQYEGVSMVKQVLHFMETSKTSENHDSYTRVMKWRGAIVSTFLSDVRKDIRHEAEIILKGEFLEQIIDFLDRQLFCIESQQVDLSGKPIEYTLVRARVHSLLFPISAKHVEFYRRYRDEELGQKVVHFLKEVHSNTINLDFNREGFDHHWLNEVTIEMIEVFPFNIRRSLASIDTVCDRYFHHFLQDGLPLHSLDALNQVDWKKFKETTSAQAVTEATSYITRIFHLNPSMQEKLHKNFGIEFPRKTCDI